MGFFGKREASELGDDPRLEELREIEARLGLLKGKLAESTRTPVTNEDERAYVGGLRSQIENLEESAQKLRGELGLTAEQGENEKA